MNERDKELAVKAGLEYTGSSNDEYWEASNGDLQRFADLIRADEREALEKMCEDLDAWNMDDPGGSAAKAIRARGNK